MSESETEAPLVARYKPYYCELRRGETYLWCACGRSRTQPFCDGSHAGTGFRPVRYEAREAGEEVLFCGCKRTGDPPFCDGSHNNLRGIYEEDDPESEANRAVATVGLAPDGKARLDGGCFVCRVPRLQLAARDGMRWGTILSAADGARHQSQFYFEVGGASPVFGFGARHVVLLVTAGRGVMTLSGRDFAVAPEVGVYARPGECIRLRSDASGVLKVFAAVCPQADSPEWRPDMPLDFQAAYPRRVVGIDPACRQAMADRFFQLLIDKRVGSNVVTQFIGEVPRSKAAPHRHLYEESIVVLRGEGFMWTERLKAPVAAGDVIFLPRKQLHSLQCTDPQGMVLAGVIYPGDNPAVNY